MSNQGTGAYSGQPRGSMASIDSVFDSDTGAGWPPERSLSHPRSNSNTSPAKDSGEGEQDGKGQDTPAWTELKTKAGKDRKRLPLACIACRRKKIKCSGEKPACKHCLKARIPCVYKVTTRKAAPRTDYMAMLDKRLKRMEDRVIKVIPKEDLPDLNVTGRSSVKPPLPGTATKKDKSQPTVKRSAEEAFDSELNEWAKPNRAHSMLDQTARVRSQRDTDNKLFTEGQDALPPQHIQEHLAEVFFDCVYGQSYLLLHKPSFMRKLKAGNVPPVLILAVCAIAARFSTHPQVSSEPAFLRGEQWANAARAIVEKRHFEPNITLLTVMLILGLHYFGTCEGGLSWSFGGQAMRMGYALQLHRELDHDPLGRAQAERAAASGKPTPQIPELSFTDREIRRRTMWACYLMDTFNSSGTERPSFLNEEYMFIQLPIKESHFQMEIPGHTEDIEGHVPLDPSSSTDQATPEIKSNMGVAAYIVRAVVIWKRIVKYLNLGGKERDSHPIWDELSQFATLQRQISALKSSLPPSLIYSQENLAAHVAERLANQFIFLHIILTQANLFLHRFAIPTAPNTHRPYPPNTPKSFLAASAKKVLESAAEISNLLADSTGHTLTVPFAGYCAYASATVHVWGIFSRNTKLEQASRENLRHNYKYLNRMKRYWGMFHYMAESVKDLYRAFADAAQRFAQRQQQHPLLAQQEQEAASADPVESSAISAQASRAASPSGSPKANDLDAATGHDSHLARKESKDSAGRSSMFQYGDWFDKYPHGVSESEWENTHLPHRRETQKGTEAVMSQQSDLQSVEEFFASLSPPSKADDQVFGNASAMRGKKVAKKRGKSIADEKGGVITSRGSTGAKDMLPATAPTSMPSGMNNQDQSGLRKPSQSSAGIIQKHRHSQSLTPSSGTIPPSLTISSGMDIASDIDIPMSGISTGLQSGQGNSAFDIASPSAMFTSPQLGQGGGGLFSGSNNQPTQSHSPFDYTSPSTSSNPGGNAQQMNFNFNYTSALPHLDRQMVFGGYAGIDPSASGSTNALNNPNNFDFWSNPWDSIDMDGLPGFTDPFGPVEGNTPQGNSSSIGGKSGGQGFVQQQQQQPQQQGLSSSAWFMPFNIEPPTYGIEDFSALDTMDMSGTDFPISPSDQRQGGSFSGPSGM